VRNLGTQALTLGPIAVPAGFSLMSDLGSMTLASGGSTSFTVRFDASTVGGFSGSVSFADNDADEGPYSFTVSAAATAGDVARFAVIGDYGAGGPSEADVAALVKSWNPDFVITVGDNNYDEGEASTIDTNIGQYYHDFIFPYQGTYGAGATVNRFFPSLGNHDWETTVGGLPQPYLDYFTLPGNERYYEFTWGPVHFMAIDSDGGEPDGISSTSPQALWLKNALANSTAPWQVVYMHHPPYSSSYHGSTAELQWPYAQWGADVVLAGHDHVYERIQQDGITYLVDGLGGASIGPFYTPIPGDQVRYSADYGALLVDASASSMTFQFITRTGQVIDSFTIDTGTPAAGASPGGIMTP
jgi:tartrate-resistant acid phosphatase type 5